MIEITKDFIPKGRKNRPAKINSMKYITIHNTGNVSKGAGAKNHANYVKSDTCANMPLSWHYTVDDKSIYQHLPENETAYHAGDGNGKGNTESIGIEICMNSDGNLIKSTNNAVELVADICIRNNIPIKNIKRHYDWNGKYCPQMLMNNQPYSWSNFIDNVVKIMMQDNLYRVRTSWSNVISQQGAFSDLNNAKKLTDELNAKTKYSVYDSKGNKVYPK